eukprot:m.20124 g.20124  ORF g.20124 m.20124 type:complete len:357 (+) comp8121_c0_seq1:116-1186(+)
MYITQRDGHKSADSGGEGHCVRASEMEGEHLGMLLEAMDNVDSTGESPVATPTRKPAKRRTSSRDTQRKDRASVRSSVSASNTSIKDPPPYGYLCSSKADTLVEMLASIEKKTEAVERGTSRDMKRQLQKLEAQRKHDIRSIDAFQDFRRDEVLQLFESRKQRVQQGAELDRKKTKHLLVKELQHQLELAKERYNSCQLEGDLPRPTRTLRKRGEEGAVTQEEETVPEEEKLTLPIVTWELDVEEVEADLQRFESSSGRSKGRKQSHASRDYHAKPLLHIYYDNAGDRLQYGDKSLFRGMKVMVEVPADERRVTGIIQLINQSTVWIRISDYERLPLQLSRLALGEYSIKVAQGKA